MTNAQLIVVNTLAWPAIHLGFAWGGTRLPPAWFASDAWFFRPTALEQGGAVYERWFRIKRWKGTLPDGAAWIQDGFPKKSLARVDTPYMERFLAETRRSEAIHWAVFCASGLFFLWNSLPVGLAMVAYAAAANLPCIAIQRYNRIRLQRLLARRRGRRLRLAG